MKLLIRIIVGVFAFAAIFILLDIYVVPAQDMTYKWKHIPKDPVKEENDDKITKVISEITSSTPSDLIPETKTEYSIMPTRYSIPPTGKVILANLDNKTIEIIEDGQTLKSMNIVSIGKPNKYYETPGGIYKIKSWETNHFSSLGHVYMPWSMQFSGNYFIHGIPYHENGERVSTQYSGGCIRLEDEDAKMIYDFSDKSTYVLVVKNDDVVATSTPIDPAQLLQLAANYKGKDVLIYDLHDNIYYNNLDTLHATMTNSNITNIAVTLTALDYVSQERNTTNASGNDAKQLALLPELLDGDKRSINQTVNYIGRGLFQAYLNNKVKSIGLENTEIDLKNSNSSTTLMDIMYTLRYIYIYKPYIMSLDKSEDGRIIWQYNISNNYKAIIQKGDGRDFLIIY